MEGDFFPFLHNAAHIPSCVSLSAHYKGMSGSFLRQDLELHRAADQYILLKWRMETNSLCVEVYKE